MEIKTFVFPLKWFRKFLLLGALFMLIPSMVLFAQRTITGTVTDSDDGQPLPGVNVIVQGTATGTITSADGTYSLDVPSGTISLQFSFIGYTIKVVQTGVSTVIDVALEASAYEMDEVVVTALGIQREEKTLTYATQTVDADELTNTRDINFMNSLSGKAAGVEIKKSYSGPGGSTRIVLRGTKSLTGSSEPLFVIDGIPMVNNKPSQGAMWGGWDGGDGLSQINPEDIESINILKGSNAASLYGSQGANGVVLITTKKGSEGAAKVSLNSGITFESPMVMPELQFDYGADAEGSQQSWSYTPGDYDDTFVKNFFQRGYNLMNSVSISGGSNRTTAYFSYANTTAKGIIPTNTYNKNNLTFKQSTKLANDKITVSSNVMLTDEKSHNRPPAGYYLNPVLSTYQFPRQMDYADYTENYEYFDPTRNIMLQNVYINDHFISNPQWILNNQPKDDKTKRAIGNVAVSWDITENLNFAVRGNYDIAMKSFEQQNAAGSNATNVHANGDWDYRNYTDELLYTDGILKYDNNFGAISLTALAGASYQRTVYGLGVSTGWSGGPTGLIYPNEFYFQNVPDNVSINSTLGSRLVKQAVFANASIGVKEWVFLDLSARNDWASSLALTGNQSYFYPAVGLTGLISNMVDLPEFISFAKVRGSYTFVGNEVPFNRVNPQHIINAGGGVNRNTQTPFTDLTPELITSMEAGADVRFFTGRLGLDFTYYHITSNDQFLSLPAPSGSGYTRYFINAGEIVNKGIEATLNATPVAGTLNWNTSLNFSRNINEVISLHEDISRIGMGGGESVSIQFEAGGSMGDLYASAFVRDDQGRITVTADGMPRKTTEREYMGNVEPDWSLGWNNNLTFGNLSLNFLINSKFGGVVISQTEAMLDGYGVSKRTADARDAGGLAVDAVTEEGTAVSTVDPKIWFLATGDRNGIMEYYVYDRTNIRLSQLALSYTLNLREMNLPLENAIISLVGRNLFFIYKEAPFDPDLVMSTNRNNQGLDNFNLPTTRTIGFNLKLNF
ncbi:MAG: SusC/RagA family TonB-linked outer membrane protein [Bacteroidota bacterium]